jgi:hypothetical protein
MGAVMSLAEPYATRSVRCLDLLTIEGWRLKLYGIAYRGERPVQALVDAAVAAAQERLPRPAVTDDGYGMGFVGVHDGRGANFVFVDWWGPPCAGPGGGLGPRRLPGRPARRQRLTHRSSVAVPRVSERCA